MATSLTQNLEVQQVEVGQYQIEKTMNTALDVFDGAIAGQNTVDLAGLSGDVTTNVDSTKRCLLLKVTGALAGAVNLIVPSSSHGYWFWHNGSGYDVTVKTASGTGITFSPTDAQIIYCDGTNIIGISSSGVGSVIPQNKTSHYTTGVGGTTVISLPTNVDPNSVDMFVDGINMYLNGEDGTITESSPGSGNYDQITPAEADKFPPTSKIKILYYPA